MIPSPEIENILFRPAVNLYELSAFTGHKHAFGYGGFQEIHWLNTPGPIYTTYTDNCGTGQPAAMDNVGGDGDYHEVIFKQPVTKEELIATVIAGVIDPFGAYFIDGSQHWNKDNIFEWWDKSKERVQYVINRYDDELNLPEEPHISKWDFNGEIRHYHLLGPVKPIPENYRSWLDFYQSGMKNYLEWYLCKLHAKAYMLPLLEFDWSRKEALDKILAEKIAKP
ncbi:hypothetical protein [Chitinophaga pinensis]|uniref:Uncharacterized protein n=1 Tax=Chitinophaga pinensis (strain ATCC 43595 / DSM 2588 / LMG 13176 / NBRC 15968 / NCIMB 11800 / UQM 2034) TaxID=485918 RepID=A0A979GQV6_CHIPD|nr:hypothetical protein [Chitinophaga pinensis]ACU61837.1 hypothetical protein Cpin_4391 [Chitinophaga pinensis DSM 2588]